MWSCDRQEWKQQIIPAKAISNKDGADWIFAPRKYLNSSLLVMLAIVWRGLASVLLYPRETSRRATVSFGRRGLLIRFRNIVGNAPQI